MTVFLLPTPIELRGLLARKEPPVLKPEDPREYRERFDEAICFATSSSRISTLPYAELSYAASIIKSVGVLTYGECTAMVDMRKEKGDISSGKTSKPEDGRECGRDQGEMSIQRDKREEARGV